MSRDMDLIWKFLDGELTVEETAVLNDRLNKDDAFGRLYQEQCEIHQSLCKTDSIEFRKQLQRIEHDLKKGGATGRMAFLNFSWLMAAAIGSFLISAGYIILRFLTDVSASIPVANTGQVQHVIIATQTDTVKQLPLLDLHDLPAGSSNQYLPENPEPAGSRSLAVNYGPLPLLEELVGTHYRSVQMTVECPANGTTFSGDQSILFRFHTLFVDSVFLSIVNNKYEVLFEKKLDVHDFTFDQKMQGGRYYFQFKTTNEILFTGKFFIE